jgi:hypothetical protein
MEGMKCRNGTTTDVPYWRIRITACPTQCTLSRPGLSTPSQRNILALLDIAAPLYEEGIEEDGLYEASFANRRPPSKQILVIKDSYSRGIHNLDAVACQSEDQWA